MMDEGIADVEEEVFYAYFGIVEIRRLNNESHITLKNYLLQSECTFSLAGSVTDVCWTHNCVFFLISLEQRIYVLRIDSTFVYCLDIGRLHCNLGFESANMTVGIEKGRGSEGDGTPSELLHLKTHRERVTILDCKKPEVCLMCATGKSCFVVKNTPAGPSMYRVFTENKVGDIQLLQLGFQEAVLQLAAGNDHLLIMTVSGKVYSMGTGSRGELGLGTLECEQQPARVDSLSPVRVTQVACGGWHSAALTADGDVYVWGWNNCGQLGECCAVGEILDIPFPLDLDETVVAVAALRNGTLLRKTDHSVLLLGTTTFS